MKRQEIFEELVEVAHRFYERVEVTRGDFRGGECLLRGQMCLFINRNAGLDANLQVICTALASQNMEDFFLLPKLRNAIEKYALK